MERAVSTERGGVPRLCRTLLVVGLAGLVLATRPSAQSVNRAESAPGEILVKFRPGASAGARSAAHGAAGATPLAEIARTGVQRVRVVPGSESATIARYQRNPNVLYAEPNFFRRIPTVTARLSGSGLVPRDARFGEQWALDNTGQSFYCIPWTTGELCLFRGTADADIDAPEAWAITSGSASVEVAVIDSGVDYTHPDLAGNFAGGDDFVSGDGDPMDDHGHGTHVAGTIAAAWNNRTGTPGAEEGVVGVAPNARIRAYKVCRTDGTCDDFAIQQAIARAIVDGARVINMSLGAPEYSRSLDDAVQDAWNAGLVIVGGAGNDGTTDRFYPAALDNVVSVGAFDEDNGRASFSNHGSWVDLSAPGSLIVSTYPMAACAQSTTPGDAGCYAYLSGTSMAAPHVAGAAALVWSRSDVTTNSQVVSILEGSADARGVGAVRLDSWTLYGGLNLHDAVSFGLANLPPVADAGPDQFVTDADGDGEELVSLDGTGSTDREGAIASYAWREGSAPIAVGASPSVWLAVGAHTLTLEVTDEGGASATDTVLVTIDPANRVTVAATTSQATEAGPTSGTFTITRAGDTSAPLVVRFSVGGTAAAGADYVSMPNVVSIVAGSSSTTVAVTPIDDGAFEGNETVRLTLMPDAAYSVGSPADAVVTIVSDDLPPDLIVTSVTTPALGAAGGTVVVTDTTANRGTGASLPSNTGFYLSLNTYYDPSDVLIGSRSVPLLGPATSHTQSTTMQVPPQTAPGWYYVLARADHDGEVAEAAEGNNLKPGGPIRIGPDLVMSALVTPASGVAGTSLVVSDTTANQGAGGADASVTRFYLSVNTLVDASDLMLGSRPVPPMAPGASSSAGTSLALPAGTPAGTYFVIAQADAADTVRETTESNNIRISAPVKLGPDLSVTALSAPSSAAAGVAIVVTDSTTNHGAGPASASATGFYLSANFTIDAADVLLGSRAVGELQAGATATGTISLQLPADIPPGSYYVIARADWNNAVAEVGEANNDRAGTLMKVGGDLLVTALSVPGTGTAGGTMTVTDTTANQGAVPVPVSTTAFYLSLDFAFSPTGDAFLGSRGVPSLPASGTSTASTPLVIPPGTAPGVYYVIGVADWGAAVAEGVETNNVRISGSLRVGPDLVVSAVSGPASVVAGGSVSAGDTTTNQGGGAAAAASATRFYLSSNTALDAGDILLGVRAVPPLGAGASHSGSVMLTIPAATPAGTYVIIAAADGDLAIAEAAENNNTRPRVITVSAGP